MPRTTRALSVRSPVGWPSHGSLSCPQRGPGPAHWELWLLRIRTDPDRRSVAATGQELILTENTWSRGCLLEAAWGTRPHQRCVSGSISHPGVFRRAGGCTVKDELWTEGGRENCVRIQIRAAEKALLLPAQAAPKGSFPLSLKFSLPSAPKVVHHSLRSAEMGF